jgi:hypothetical protein
MEAWALAKFTHQTTEGTVQLNAEGLGKIKTLDLLIELLEEMMEEGSDQKS